MMTNSLNKMAQDERSPTLLSNRLIWWVYGTNMKQLLHSKALQSSHKGKRALRYSVFASPRCVRLLRSATTEAETPTEKNGVSNDTMPCVWLDVIDHTTNEALVHITSQPMDDWAGCEKRVFQSVSVEGWSKVENKGKAFDIWKQSEMKKMQVWSILALIAKPFPFRFPHTSGTIAKMCMRSRFGRKV